MQICIFHIDDQPFHQGSRPQQRKNQQSINETYSICRSRPTVCGTGSSRCGSAGAAHNTLSTTGIMAFLPFLATPSRMAPAFMVRNIYSQLPSSWRDDFCTKGQCRRHHGDDGVALHIRFHPRRFRSPTHHSSRRIGRGVDSGFCSAQCQRRVKIR